MSGKARSFLAITNMANKPCTLDGRVGVEAASYGAR
jgi:hypothetical protein